MGLMIGGGDDAKRIDAMLGWDIMKKWIVGRMIGGGDDAAMLGWDNMKKKIVGRMIGGVDGEWTTRDAWMGHY